MDAAKGERIAVLGYHAQYMVSAELIYNALLEARLEGIRITDPEAGQVDDILIASPGRLDAYQVKWGESVDNISFNCFISGEKGKDGTTKSSLVSQLANGWKKLSTKYSYRHVVVHLICKGIPSPKAKIPLDEPLPLKPNFQGFLKDCWYDKKWIKKGIEAVPAGWQSAMLAIQKAAGLDDTAFLKFFECCNLHFQHQLFKDRYPLEHKDKQKIRDIEDICNQLIQLAGGEKRVIEVSGAELLEKLGWEGRFQFRFRHEFPVDKGQYQPIRATINELEASLKRFNRGYLALIGTPGSGKSTTLEMKFRYHREFRIVRYYAFVPDDTRIGRGEALYFLHDIVMQLDRQGVQGNGKNPTERREEILEKLGSQLAELGDRWHKDRIITLILVDGLDHIEREQNPERTLLKDLPHPESIPEGVLFILGSQKVDLLGLPGIIRTQLNEEGRIITMYPLERQAVFAVIDTAPLVIEITYSQKEKILKLSEGHPLALKYFLQKLQNVSNSNRIESILDESNPYYGNIEKEYEIYWKSLEEDVEIKKLLGYISRLRGVINLNDVETWLGEPVVERFRKKGCHLFRKENVYRWFFFHNSFRQFILSKTGRKFDVLSDEARHRNYHRELADYAAKAKPGTPWSWEELYHRFCAGENKAVIQLSSQDYFRKQFCDFRPLDDITGDLSLLWKAAREEQDGLAIIRAFLIENELYVRNRNGFSAKIPHILLEMENIDASLRYVLYNNFQLRFTKNYTLEFCNVLIKKGEVKKAQKIFENAEPLEVLSGSRGIEIGKLDNNDFHTVIYWAKVAYYFRSFQQIFQAVDQLQADTSDNLQDIAPGGMAGYLRRSVLVTMADSILESQDREKLMEFQNFLYNRGDPERINFYIDCQLCLRTEECIDKIMPRILEWAKNNHPDNEEKIAIAEVLFKANRKVDAAEWIKDIPQPPLYLYNAFTAIKHEFEEDTLAPFRQRIRLNRLLTALGKPLEPETAVPGPKGLELNTVLERLIVLIANTWGRAWGGEVISPVELIRELRPAMDVVHMELQGRFEIFPRWYYLKQVLMQDYFAYIIRAVSAHGEGALKELGNILEARWSSDQEKQYWELNWRLHIAGELFHAECQFHKDNTGAKEAFFRRLSLMEVELLLHNKPSERGKAGAKLALAWLEIEERERAQALMKQIFKNSFAFDDEKGNEFIMWVKWLGRLNFLNKEDMEEYMRRFASAFAVLKRSNPYEHGDNFQQAGCEMLQMAASLDLGVASTLQSWLLDQGLIHYTTAIESMIMAALNTPEAPVEIAISITRHLLVPFRLNCNHKLIKTLVSKCIERRSDIDVRLLLEPLNTTILTKTFPSRRRQWLEALTDGCRQAGFDTSWIKSNLEPASKENDQVKSPRLTLKSGDTITEEEAIGRINSFEDILELLNSIDRCERFHWERVLLKLIDKLDEFQIKELKNGLEKFQPGETVMILLAKRMASLGHINDAQELAEEALKTPKPSAWGYYDFGPRLEILQVIANIGGVKGSKKAYKILVDDCLSDIWQSKAYAKKLDRLIPIFFDNPPLKEIWAEIEQHIYHFSEFSNIESSVPSFSEEPVNLSAKDILLQLLTRSFTLPVTEIRQEIHKAFCELITNRAADSEIRDCLINFLKQDDDYQVRVLAIFESTAALRPDFLEWYESEISHLCISPNMIVRNLAQNLAFQLKLKPAPIEEKRRELPFIYKIQIPGFKLPDSGRQEKLLLSDEDYCPAFDHPLEMIYPMQKWYEKLAGVVGIPCQNLVQRGAALMKTLEPPSKWNKQAEKKFHQWLREINLDLSFHRFGVDLALHAFGYVLAELTDARLMNETTLSLFLHRIVLHDPALSLKEPVPRPLEIIVHNDEEMKAFPKKEWINAGHEVFPIMPDRMRDGRVILGQLTRITRIDGQRPREFRFSMLCHSDFRDINECSDSLDFFPSSRSNYGFEYQDFDIFLQIGAFGDYSSAVILYVEPYQVELGGIEWLALNPLIPLSLGWKYSHDGLFRWLDSKSNLMVESIMWQDGFINLRQETEGICSEGWLVVASPGAAKRINTMIGSVDRIDAVVRIYDDSEKKRSVHGFALSRNKCRDFIASQEEKKRRGKNV